MIVIDFFWDLKQQMISILLSDAPTGFMYLSLIHLTLNKK